MTFEELYQEYKDLVFNLTLQYVQQAEDAEEITQDVFVSVYQSLSNFKHQSKYSTWIYRITINKSLDFIRSRKRKKRIAFVTGIFFGDHNFSQIKTFDHPGVQLEQKEVLEKIFKHINALPDRQKTALILSKIEQLSQQEIAHIMNLSTKAVESLVQRAKNNLQQKLDSEG
ncbi:MAG TPA: RNA polymerase sigma factor [Flavipsychrobacter sp.]|nr:RNA polymerase sigma factor [Flavipsychrobacter sp.]